MSIEIHHKCDRCGCECNNTRFFMPILETYRTTGGHGWSGTGMMKGILNFFKKKLDLDRSSKPVFKTKGSYLSGTLQRRIMDANAWGLCNDCAHSVNNVLREWWHHKDGDHTDAFEIIAEFVREVLNRSDYKEYPRKGEVSNLGYQTVYEEQIHNFLRGRIGINLSEKGEINVQNKI